jgi:lysophospholipase L1-like esterase
VVLLHAGGNDALQGADATTMIDRARALMACILAHSSGIHVVIGDLIPPWRDPDRDVASVAAARYNEALVRLVDELGPRVVLARMSVIPNRLLGDGLHPCDEGYQAMAWIWLRALGLLISQDGIVRSGRCPLPVNLPIRDLCHLGGH